MTTQFSTPVRNARLDSIEVAIGASAILKLRTLAPPANCAAADVGAALATINLPANWMDDANAGVKAKSAGLWQVAASAPGVIAHYRIYANDGVTCHIQGTVTITGGGGDMTLDNTNVAAAQVVTVTTYSLTDPNG